MKTLHRLLLSLCLVLSTLVLTVVVPGTARAQPTAPSAQPMAASPSSCSSVREIGTKKVVQDKGMSAFTVRQYIGWCSDDKGWAWMNYASVYVWSQYHALGFSYRAQVGILVQGENEARGYVVGANRSRLTYSSPVRTVAWCTQGWGKLARTGGESALGRSSLVC